MRTRQDGPPDPEAVLLFSILAQIQEDAEEEVRGGGGGGGKRKRRRNSVEEQPPAKREKAKKTYKIPKGYAVTDWSSLVRLASLSAEKNRTYKMSQGLGDMYPVLKEFDELVGMEDLKATLFEIILSHIVADSMGRVDTKMRHMSLVGPTGVGKTTVARLLGKLLHAMEILKSPDVIMAKRANMVGKYVGHTAHETQSMIDSAMKKGQLLFFDEIYSLQGDVFASEAVTTLLSALTDYPDKFICVVAGYEGPTKEFFKTNEGLTDRFPYHLRLKPYGPEELSQIAKVKLANMETEDGIAPAEWFAKNKEYFTSNGRSVENIVSKVQVARDVRVHGLGKPDIVRQVDLEAALDTHKRYFKKEPDTHLSMYM